MALHKAIFFVGINIFVWSYIWVILWDWFAKGSILLYIPYLFVLGCTLIIRSLNYTLLRFLKIVWNTLDVSICGTPAVSPVSFRCSLVQFIKSCLYSQSKWAFITSLSVSHYSVWHIRFVSFIWLYILCSYFLSCSFGTISVVVSVVRVSSSFAVFLSWYSYWYRCYAQLLGLSFSGFIFIPVL